MEPAARLAVEGAPSIEDLRQELANPTGDAECLEHARRDAIGEDRQPELPWEP